MIPHSERVTIKDVAKEAGVSTSPEVPSQMKEMINKLSLIREWLDGHKLDALYLRRTSSFAWATCGGRAYVNTASTEGAASLLITAEKQFLFTNNIESPRLEKEEQLATRGWDFHLAPWHGTNEAVADLTRGLRLAVDEPFPGGLDVSAELSRMRACLSPEEGTRFRELGHLCAAAMDAAIRVVRPGMTEYEIAGLLAGEAEKRGVQAIVNLIAADERIFNFRHPLPTDKKLDRYAMMVLCGRKYGLVCSITRLVHFGKLPDEIRRKADAVARVDATFIVATRPSRTLGDVFSIAQKAYTAAGFPDEWQLHHQGGPAGFEPREYVATPGSQDVVVAGQVYAWNPSITGTKSEDSVLITENGFEVLSEIPNWPTIKVEVDGQIIERPDILVVK
jgi:Xaa-Pro aminopeptidase